MKLDMSKFVTLLQIYQIGKILIQILFQNCQNIKNISKGYKMMLNSNKFDSTSFVLEEDKKYLNDIKGKTYEHFAEYSAIYEFDANVKRETANMMAINDLFMEWISKGDN
jgi:hypothetical protein